MSEVPFEVGDVVELAGGDGPPLTVVEVKRPDPPEPMVRCSWFADGRKYSDDFPPAALRQRKPGQLGYSK